MKVTTIGLVAATSFVFAGCEAERASNNISICPADDPACLSNGGGAGAGGLAESASDLPCDVAPIAGTHCVTCHASQPLFGAPMPLVTVADYHATAPTQPTRYVYDVANERINLPTALDKMPPISASTLQPAELSTFSAWLQGGAPAAPATQAACPPVGGVVAPGDTASPNDTATGMTPNTPVDLMDTSVEGEYNDECTSYFFLAHAPGNKDAPFQVGAARDAYTNFTFMAPWQGTQYARWFKVSIDNVSVDHHWLFYKGDSSAGGDGAVAASSGIHIGAELVHGWAPGGSDLLLPPDVGMEMPAVFYTLEHHYNSSDPSAVDRGGVEVCVSPTRPANIAGISWLGTDNIAGTSATGTCRPPTTGPITMLGATPHMHQKGVHMKAEWTHASGGSEMLHDQPFDFNYQISYDFDPGTIFMPGDAITVTCNYNSPTSFGEGTGDEMCYFFVLHYPAGSLTQIGGAISFAHGPNTCLGN